MFANKYQKELINLFNHILEYRDYEEMILKENPDFKGQITEDELKKVLNGNIATCALLKDGKEISNTFISSSFNNRFSMREKQFNSYDSGTTLQSRVVTLTGSGGEDETFRHTRKDKICVFSPPPGSESITAEPFFCGSERRLFDSERLLFNLLHKLINDHPKSFDTILLVTERIPCKSCTNIIIDFIRIHGIQVNIAYWINTGNKELRDIEKLRTHIKKHKRQAKLINLCEITCKDGADFYYIDRPL
ncbi:deaminase domain-containing protein [Pantoea septica]|uniref:deaminase domain-containing protein n=1 Tax=Pantoea septica TaxID=472695 RepID=UPI0028A5B538|nr:deaminase domain-containing protein [Pantoea septica]